MEFPSKLLEQIAFNTRPKKEEHMLVVMDKSTHGEYLSQPLQTINKQFIIAVTFLTDYNGIFNVTLQLRKSIKYHNYKLQDIYSKLCGSYCLYFFYLIGRMNYYDAILKMFFG